MFTAIEIFQQGGVLAYPTEAVFGLGCDPDNQTAVEKLLQIKNRDKAKGLILLAGSFEQLTPYIDLSKLTHTQIDLILSRWPNGVTQVLPAQASVSSYLTGDFSTIAVRVTDQPDVVSLCSQTKKPIVSTSANLSGLEPARTWQTLDPTLTQMIDHLIKGETLGYMQPSKIIDGLTGEVFRT
ncbi:Sua5/YciO/YrdC/YwlC family protein [Colwellia sp. UCD-KL20]|uniref:Sua5/YciO/YrdC/YwlC family protein n=1 Tax=Colwellia sp. UCD-KL20 TaxID=1917165 RepID=UPI000971490C|nr:Sua5/YciO/YrdC/YwlC family protein [Colwellia sp. UCD-KL20]